MWTVMKDQWTQRSYRTMIPDNDWTPRGCLCEGVATESIVGSGTLDDVLRSYYSDKWVEKWKLSPFCEDILKWCIQILPRSKPVCGKEVREQLMWRNVSIRVGRKTVHHSHLARIRTKHTDDFLDDSRVMDECKLTGIWEQISNKMRQSNDLPCVASGWSFAVERPGF